MISRIVNEFSHLTHFDRARSPIDVAVLKECAELILNKIEELDPQQYKSLVACVDS